MPKPVDTTDEDNSRKLKDLLKKFNKNFKDLETEDDDTRRNHQYLFPRDERTLQNLLKNRQIPSLDFELTDLLYKYYFAKIFIAPTDPSLIEQWVNMLKEADDAYHPEAHFTLMTYYNEGKSELGIYQNKKEAAKMADRMLTRYKNINRNDEMEHYYLRTEQYLEQDYVLLLEYGLISEEEKRARIVIDTLNTIYRERHGSKRIHESEFLDRVAFIIEDTNINRYGAKLSEVVELAKAWVDNPGITEQVNKLCIVLSVMDQLDNINDEPIRDIHDELVKKYQDAEINAENIINEIYSIRGFIPDNHLMHGIWSKVDAKQAKGSSFQSQANAAIRYANQQKNMPYLSSEEKSVCDFLSGMNSFVDIDPLQLRSLLNNLVQSDNESKANSIIRSLQSINYDIQSGELTVSENSLINNILTIIDEHKDKSFIEQLRAIITFAKERKNIPNLTAVDNEICNILCNISEQTKIDFSSGQYIHTALYQNEYERRSSEVINALMKINEDKLNIPESNLLTKICETIEKNTSKPSADQLNAIIRLAYQNPAQTEIEKRLSNLLKGMNNINAINPSGIKQIHAELSQLGSSKSSQMRPQ